MFFVHSSVMCLSRVSHDRSCWCLYIVGLILLLSSPTSTACTFEPDDSATCEAVQHSLCHSMDNFQSHNFTSLPNIFGSATLELAEEDVRIYSQRIDTSCSQFAAHLICTAAYPICVPNVAQRVGPCRELCEEVKTSCGLSNEDLTCDSLPNAGSELCAWKDIDCRSTPQVPTEVNSISTPMSSTTDCNGHLISINDSRASFGGRQNCVDPCRSIYFENHQSSLLVISMTILNLLCFVTAVFAILTFALNFRALLPLESFIFYAAASYLGLSLTNVVSVAIGRTDLICDTSVANIFNETAIASDGRSGSVCQAMFSFGYYFTLCSWAWWCAATLKWFLFCIGVKSISVSATITFHVVSWCLPLLFLLSVLWKGEIAGDPITQTCWISKNQKLPFVIAPLGFAIVFCCFFILLRFSCVLSPKHKNRMREEEEKWQGGKYDVDGTPSRSRLVRINVYIMISLAVMGVLFCCYFYDFWYRPAWDRIYLKCSPEPTLQTCQTLSSSEKPSLAVYLAQIAASISMGVLTVMWVLKRDLMQTWKKTFTSCLPKKRRGREFVDVRGTEEIHRVSQMSPISLKIEEESEHTTV